jgi:predicted GNAT family acetyltransferase
MTAHSVTDNEERSRLELRIDGELAGWVDYRPAGDSIILAHTEVLSEHEGKGLGGVLVRGALESARSADKTVIVVCPFAVSYIDRNPELDEYLAPHARRRRPPA